jgi:hypothetical protein
MTSEELDRYFEIGLEHFSKNPDVPFNFLSSALKYNPINATFEEHLVNLFVYMTENFPEWSETEILKRTAPLVGSCVFLDIIRKRYPYRGECVLFLFNGKILIGNSREVGTSNSELYEVL